MKENFDRFFDSLTVPDLSITEWCILIFLMLVGGYLSMSLGDKND